MPAGDSLGMALVLVQHLDPDHKSLLLDLVKRYTHIEVAWAEDGTEVRPGCAYVMPPNKDMALVDGRLTLVEPEAPRGLRLPIDYFFRSLAADQRERAVCIVLSGTGSDGTLGLRAIKGEGGMAIAQSPESAGYDGMPRSAIGTGLVDYVLAPAEMPEQLLGYVSRAFGREPQPARAAASGRPDQLLEVLHLLRDRSGHDFTHYKTNTLRRRVERRMAVTRIERMDDYLALLRRDALEAETLFRELLIGVTNFFRDAPAFEALAAEALAPLVAARRPGDPVRVWVPGCSTGEEAYSIAMLLQEQAGAAKRNVPVQVFATDIDAEAIERARAGVYPGSIGADVSPERLARFFVQDGDTYRVAKSVRDCLVFAKQDVTKDPPFSRVDLISCRNLLIYMDGDLQQRLMPLFHYALNADGYLFLGSSETVGDAGDLFAPVDKKWKLFKRRGAVTPRDRLLTSTMPLPGAVAGRRDALGEQPVRLRVRDLAERALLERHAPACAVISADGDVLYIHGRTGRYLEPPAGEPSGSIHKMAREGLRLELSAGVRRVLAEKEAVRYERLRVRTNGGTSLVTMTIEPMAGPDAVKGVLLVLFEDVPAPDDVVERDLRGAHRRPRAAHRRSGPRALGQGGVPAHHRGGARDLQRGAQVDQRGDAVVQRGAAVDERGAGDLPGGAAVGQRGAGHRQQRAAAEDRGALARQQRHEQHARRHRHRHAVRRPAAAHPALHSRGHGDPQPHPDRHRPAARRHRPSPHRPDRRGGRRDGGARHPGDHGDAGPGQRRARLRDARAAVPHPRQRDRGRGAHVRRRHRAAAAAGPARRAGRGRRRGRRVRAERPRHHARAAARARRRSRRW